MHYLGILDIYGREFREREKKGHLPIALYPKKGGVGGFPLQSCRCATEGSTKANSSLLGVGGFGGKAPLINAVGTGAYIFEGKKRPSLLSLQKVETPESRRRGPLPNIKGHPTPTPFGKLVT